MKFLDFIPHSFKLRKLFEIQLHILSKKKKSYAHLTFRHSDIITAPSVKEGPYNLVTDGIACQIWDLIEVISPGRTERISRRGTRCHIILNCRRLKTVCVDMKPVKQVFISITISG